jgi:hypothetical protein
MDSEISRNDEGERSETLVKKVSRVVTYLETWHVVVLLKSKQKVTALKVK